MKSIYKNDFYKDKKSIFINKNFIVNMHTHKLKKNS